MAIDYATLSPGQKVSEQVCRLDPETIRSYVDAVDDKSADWSLHGGEGFVPPMAVAAFGFRGLINDLEIPGGAIHGGQDIEFEGAVQAGETLISTVTILQNSVRRGIRFVVVQIKIQTSNARPVLTGKSTLMLPAEEVGVQDAAR